MEPQISDTPMRIAENNLMVGVGWLNLLAMHVSLRVDR